jgi:hypothetical protein
MWVAQIIFPFHLIAGYPATLVGEEIKYIDCRAAGRKHGSFPSIELSRRKERPKMFVSLQLWVFLPLAFVGLSSAVPLATPGPDDIFASIALQNVYKVLNGTISDGITHSSCTKEKLIVRKE